jgi:P4 family phage/plasmid primase-like protien
MAGTWLDPDLPTPLWNKFLNRVTAGDRKLQAYLRRVAGYCMTGEITEHVMFFLYGTGANGKGVFLNTLQGIWGDYCVTAPMDTFLQSRSDRHPTELAFLHGARLVIAQENERNRHWAQAKLQSLTGGDVITARYMRQDFFQFKPKFKLMIAGNHKPSLSSVDEAIRRRLHLIPFNVTIPLEERDKDLPEKLKKEWPGILQWAVKGCLKWQKLGLAQPTAVRAASEAYFKEEDAIANWIEDRCAVDKAYSRQSSELFRDWKSWAEAAGERPGSNKRFTQSLEGRGYKTKHTEHGTVFFGIALKP